MPAARICRKSEMHTDMTCNLYVLSFWKVWEMKSDICYNILNIVQWMYVKQNLPALPEHLISPPGFSVVFVARSLAFCILLFVLLYFYLLAIVFYVLLWFTAFDYSFSILKLFLDLLFVFKTLQRAYGIYRKRGVLHHTLFLWSDRCQNIWYVILSWLLFYAYDGKGKRYYFVLLFSKSAYVTDQFVFSPLSYNAFQSIYIFIYSTEHLIGIRGLRLSYYYVPFFYPAYKILFWYQSYNFHDISLELNIISTHQIKMIVY
jgi:hypothetical protein